MSANPHLRIFTGQVDTDYANSFMDSPQATGTLPAGSYLDNDRLSFFAFLVGIENENTSFVLAAITKYIDENLDLWTDEGLIEFVKEFWDDDIKMCSSDMNIQHLKSFLYESKQGVPVTSNINHQLSSFIPRVLRNVLMRGLTRSGVRAATSTKMDSVSLFMNVFVLLVDISGFTRLSGSFCSKGKAGIDDLQKVTNGFMGSLVRVIYTYGGDIIKFAGDAIIAIFPADIEASFLMSESTQTECSSQLDVFALPAVGCAIALKDLTYEGLTVHVAVSMGPVCFGTLGGCNNRWENLISGSCIFEISQCLDDAPSKHCVVTPSVAALIEHNETWELRKIDHSGNFNVQPKIDDSFAASSPRESKTPVKTPSSLKRGEIPTESILQKFVPLPVLKYAQNDSFNYLAELRKVTTVFMKWDSFDPEVHRDLTSLQEPFLAAQTIILQAGGFIRQFLVDDKGCVLIAIWGVPTSVYLDCADRALKSAVAIRSALGNMSMKCSFGITTGNVYCGCVGSKLRREYAAIGNVVNMAARLMCKANGGIYVDEKTTKDLLPLSFLSLKKLDPIMVKGKDKPINVYSHQFLADLGTEEGELDQNQIQSKHIRPSCKDFFDKQIARLQRTQKNPTLDSIKEEDSGAGSSFFRSNSPIIELTSGSPPTSVTFSRMASTFVFSPSDKDTSVSRERTNNEGTLAGRFESSSPVDPKGSAYDTFIHSFSLQYVLVEGSVGSGKGTMINWLRSECELHNLLVLNVRLVERDCLLNYSVIASLFRSLVGEDVCSDAVELKRVIAEMLKVIYNNDRETGIVVGLTALQLVVGIDPLLNINRELNVDPKFKSGKFLPTHLKISAIVSMFGFLLEQKGCAVVVIENIHFADDGSLKLLLELQKLKHCNALIVMTAKYAEDVFQLLDEGGSGKGYELLEESRQHATLAGKDLIFLSMYRAILLRLKCAVLIDLLDYEKSEIAAMLRSYYPKMKNQLLHNLTNVCYQVSGGNPFWFGELMVYITNTGVSSFMHTASSLEQGFENTGNSSGSITNDKELVDATTANDSDAIRFTYSSDGANGIRRSTGEQSITARSVMSSHTMFTYNGNLTDHQMGVLEVFVLCRYELLSADEQMTIRTMAIFGTSFDIESCRGVLSPRMASMLNATVLKLSGLRWVVKLGWDSDKYVSDNDSLARTRSSTYRFGHPLFQKVLYNVTPPSERMYMHRSIGEYVASLAPTTDRCLSVSKHFLCCADQKKYVAYRIQAAQLALSDFNRGPDFCVELLCGISFLHSINDPNLLRDVASVIEAAKFKVLEITALVETAAHSSDVVDEKEPGIFRKVASAVFTSFRHSKRNGDVKSDSLTSSRNMAAKLDASYKASDSFWRCCGSNHAVAQDPLTHPSDALTDSVEDALHQSLASTDDGNPSMFTPSSYSTKGSDVLLVKIEKVLKGIDSKIRKIEKKQERAAKEAAVSAAASVTPIRRPSRRGSAMRFNLPAIFARANSKNDDSSVDSSSTNNPDLTRHTTPRSFASSGSRSPHNSRHRSRHGTTPRSHYSKK